MYCIYHSRDLDGFASGAIVKKKYPEAVLIGFDYGQDYDKLKSKIPKDSEVIMVDVSLPMPDMNDLAFHASKFTWIDHHISAINDYINYFQIKMPGMTVVLENGLSACEGTWKHLFPELRIPMAVTLLGEYDTWRQEDKEHWDWNVLPFQYGMRLTTSNPESFPMHLLNPDFESVADYLYDITQTGVTILKYQKQQNTIAMRGAFEIDFMGHIAICCNAGGLNSIAFDSVYDPDKHDIMMPFKYNGKHWTFSMYTTKDDIDCSILAKQMGGGGHKKAAGFEVKTLPWFMFTEAHDLFLQSANNLGHQSYGLSLSTTIAIDELREKALDYLDIPKE